MPEAIRDGARSSSLFARLSTAAACALLGLSACSRASLEGGEPAAASTRIEAAAVPRADAEADVAPEPEAAPRTEAPSSCPDGMLEVEGDYCPELERACLEWMPAAPRVAKGPRRCARFADRATCRGRVVHKRFCIDKYEYPNEEGARPHVMTTWIDAKRACGAVGKRLCTGSEWTLACEGPEHLPYPHGLVRDDQACNIDKPYRYVDKRALVSARERSGEVDRLWQGEPSGSRAACVSAYGVHDMTGNVDEWVVNERGKPFQSGSKGGYWGPVRARCRPMTTVHDEHFAFYQLGFRCCGEASAPR